MESRGESMGHVKTPIDTVAAIDEAGWARILNSRQAYYAEVSPAYDEVLDRVAERVKGEGSIGKADIGALLFWKRLRADTPWFSRLMAIPDASVRQTTALVVSSANDPPMEQISNEVCSIGHQSPCFKAAFLDVRVERAGLNDRATRGRVGVDRRHPLEADDEPSLNRDAPPLSPLLAFRGTTGLTWLAAQRRAT